MAEKVSQVETQRQQTMVRGMAWLTAGNFISRFLGIAYIIPWYLWLGEHREEANALANMGYQVYANFLLISTVGLPTAVAKQIAKYNVLGKQETSYYLVREFFKLMLLLGAVFAGIMYLVSPLLAEASGSKELLLPVMHSLVPPIFIFPAMSIMRGFFQGHHDMKPYALSQILEQVMRVAWILGSTFYIMKLGSGNYHEVVVQTTSAAFWSMLASVAVLVYILYQRGYVAKIMQPKPASVEIDLKSLIFETIKEAIPLIILGSTIQIFQFIDQLGFVHILGFITKESKAELFKLYTYMTSNPSKITMVIIGIAVSIGSVAISMITERFVEKDKRGTARLIEDNLQMLFLLIIPAIIGGVLLARPLYSVFYGKADTVAVYLFMVNLLLILAQGLYAVLEVIIQGVFENRRAIHYFFAGLLVKLALQLPFLYLFHAYGPLLSSAVGLMVTVVLIYRRLAEVVPLNHERILKNTIVITIMALMMGLAVGLVELFLYQFILPTGYISSALHILISGSLGVLIYGFLTLKTRQLDKLIGNRAVRLRKKFRIS